MLIQELPCLDSNIAGQLLLIEFCNKIPPIADVESGIAFRRSGPIPDLPASANMGKRCILHLAAKGVCRNHRGEPAVRMPSAGIHLQLLSHHRETSPVGALRSPDVPASGNNAKSVRCS
jgi:hypothetical protein